MALDSTTIERFPEIFEDVLAERRRAEYLHDGDAGIETAVDWISLITEELGEASDHANALRWAASRTPGDPQCGGSDRATRPRMTGAGR